MRDMEEAVSAAARRKGPLNIIVLLDRSQESECKSVNRKPPRNRRKEYEVNDRPGDCDHSHCSDCDHSRLNPQQIRIKQDIGKVLVYSSSRKNK